MNEHDVVIAGGGPTGLMLAGELALAGVDVAIVERRASQALDGSRGGGIHARTIEVLDQRGIAERFIAEGKPHGVVYFHEPLDVSDFPTRHNYTLALWQSHIERILADWVDELAVPIRREREVVGFAEEEDGVDIALADGTSLRAQYLAGCDGGRSVVRKAAGIEFAGSDPTMSWLIAEAEWSEEPTWGLRKDATGLHGVGKLENGRARMVLTERDLVRSGEPTLDEVRAALKGIYGSDFGIHSPNWISRFNDATRQATRYRSGRVILAGDAAHVHPPVGGQGLNLGVQDAVNLGWKLAQVVKRTSPASLLDTYHDERHAIGARVLWNTMAQVALRRTDERSRVLAECVTELLRMDEPRKRWAGEMSGLAIRYDFGEGHPLLGRRMPDLDIETGDDVLRVYSLLHRARPLLIHFGALERFDIAPWTDRVPSLDARYDGAWELPVIGTVDAPRAVLVRPDGHVAWVGTGTYDGLADALAKWFGAPLN
jgi:3-(3-hydroxy-phenyl)propionate hydroxylase